MKFCTGWPNRGLLRPSRRRDMAISLFRYSALFSAFGAFSRLRRRCTCRWLARSPKHHDDHDDHHDESTLCVTDPPPAGQNVHSARAPIASQTPRALQWGKMCTQREHPLRHRPPTSGAKCALSESTHCVTDPRQLGQNVHSARAPIASQTSRQPG